MGVILMASVAESATPIWRWTDSSGHINYAAQPPAGVPAERIEKIPGKPAADSPPEGPAEESGTDDQDAIKRRLDEFAKERAEREKKQIQDQQQRQAAQQIEDACKRTQSNLDALTSRGRASVLEGEEYRALTEEERQSRIQAAQQFLSSHCKPGPTVH
jgi:hypothetical protein